MPDSNTRQWLRGAHDAAQLPAKPGIYYFRPTRDVQVCSLLLKEHQVIYVGRSLGSLKHRLTDHWTPGKTPLSTLRRTLGALLRKQLELEPVAGGKSYGFDPAGEAALTRWMDDHLEFRVVHCPTAAETKREEQNAIQRFKPILNIDGIQNKNPVVVRARKSCRDLAKGTAKAKGNTVKAVSGSDFGQ